MSWVVRRGRRWAVVVLLLVVASVVPAAAAGGDGPGGPSTVDVGVLAQDPGRADGAPRMTLVARTDASAVPSASLVLRVDGLEVRGLTAHRVAVGDTSCGGHEEPITALDGHGGVRAVVRGVAVVQSGAAGLPDGALAQVWFDLEDRGHELYGDRARVRVRPAPHGGEGASVMASEDSCTGGAGGWTIDSGWRSIQQVQLHLPSR